MSSAPTRSIGVKRQSSSRPVGSGKSATSNEVVRSARDWSGTGDPGPCECSTSPCWAGWPGCWLDGLRADDLLLQAFSVRTVGRSGQPTAPSICSSIRRFSSRAYSIGSSRAIGSMKPRTIIAIASSSLIPRDIR